MTQRPFFSVVTPVYDPPVQVLTEMIASVTGQSDADLELVLVDDRSTRDEVRACLRDHAEQDPRIRVIERAQGGGIVAASNDAVAAARGEFLVLVDHDDLLTPDALAVVRSAVEAHPDADYLYSDEDKLGEDGQFYDHDRKPDWSPERLRGHMYTGHLSVMRTALVRELGGFRVGFDGSQDHDLALRVSEAAREVHHIPEVLYHWRVVPGSAAGDAAAKPYAWDAGVRAVQEHLDRTGVAAVADKGWLGSTYRVRRWADPNVLVSVVIATDGAVGRIWGQDRVFVVDAVRSLLSRAGHPRFELIVVHTPATPDTVLSALADLAGDRLRLVESAPGVSTAAAANLGVLRAAGSVLVLLDQRSEVRSENLLTELIAPLDEGGVGAVGARTLGEDGRLRHAGWVHVDRTMEPFAWGRRPEEHGPFAALQVAREASALGDGVLAVRREDFLEAGGLNETALGSLADVDLSLKLRAGGLRAIWQPEAQVYRFGSTPQDQDRRVFDARWGSVLDDPYLPGAR
ncbi:glycosyltransferase [Cellulomonas sp. NPDC089187]|uniref:glycosyltransferase family 2 protein n=1 Tax=Cellulomonas sp. NPDC089187 TaxID=3154970 RepID=UPI00343D81F3